MRARSSSSDASRPGGDGAVYPRLCSMRASKLRAGLAGAAVGAVEAQTRRHETVVQDRRERQSSDGVRVDEQEQKRARAERDVHGAADCLRVLLT